MIPRTGRDLQFSEKTVSTLCGFAHGVWPRASFRPVNHRPQLPNTNLAHSSHCPGISGPNIFTRRTTDLRFVRFRAEQVSWIAKSLFRQKLGTRILIININSGQKFSGFGWRRLGK